MSNRDLLNRELNAEEDLSLRPQKLNDFIGQESIKYNLSVFIKAAKTRKESLDHVILYSPPGLGKTSLASIIAREMEVNIKSTSAPILSKPADLATILTNLSHKDILFIDEIHRLSTNVEEILYSAMEDYKIDILIGEGVSARSIKIDLAKFTLIGATTRIGLLSNPLRDRFSIQIRLNFYLYHDLVKIINKMAERLNSELTHHASSEIARRSRGTPRIALRLFRRVRDYALVYEKKIIDEDISKLALNYLLIDKLGLDSNDHRYLKFIQENYNGGPVGLETISAGLSEQKDAIEETIEPYLIQIGLVHKTPKGRVITQQAIEHIKSC